MFDLKPILVDDIKFYRGRRGVQPPYVISAEIHRTVALLGLGSDSPAFHAWADLLADAARQSSGNRPDAVWTDDTTNDAVLICKDGYPSNARRGLMGLTAAEFAYYHVDKTATDIHNMHANAAAFMHKACRKWLIDPLSEREIADASATVLTETRRGDVVRGFLYRRVLEPA